MIFEVYKTMQRGGLSLLCCTLFTIAVSAQGSATDTPSIVQARKDAISLYYRFMASQSRLYNGTDRPFYNPAIKGSPYFLTDSLQTGSVTYDSLLFDKVLMQYDICRDELTIKHFQGYYITLLSEKILSFDMAGHHFVRHEFNKNTGPVQPTGFYDHLYDGKTTVLAKRTIVLEERVTNAIEQYFVPHDTYFIWNKGEYHPCSSLANLRSILKDRAREIKQYLRKNKVKFKSDPETALVMAARFYDSKK